MIKCGHFLDQIMFVKGYNLIMNGKDVLSEKFKVGTCCNISCVGCKIGQILSVLLFRNDCTLWYGLIQHLLELSMINMWIVKQFSFVRWYSDFDSRQLTAL